MENKKEDTKDRSQHDKTDEQIERKISELEKKFNEVSHTNEKKLIEAKLTISEKRVTFLLAILALLGILYPIYKTEHNTEKVDNAIEKMESRFKELTGEYLRKPEIVCDISGENLLNNTLTVGRVGDEISQTFRIKNTGDASAGRTYVYLYVNHKEDNFSLWYSCESRGFSSCEIAHSDNQQYDTKFSVMQIGGFHSGRNFDLQFKHNIEIDSPLEVLAMLKIYYDGPQPIEIPFTMRFIPKENKK